MSNNKSGKTREIHIGKFTVDSRVLIAAVLIVVLVIFLFNVLKFNRKADVSEATMKANQKQIEDFQKASVQSVEEAVDALSDAAKDANTPEGQKARYLKKFANAIVVGDSVTEGISLYGWLPEEKVFSKVGASVINGEEMFDQAAKTYPKTAFFAFGMNDMGNYGGDAAKFTKDYTKLLKAFKKTSPKTKIYICSITTPTEAAQAKNKSITHYEEFNDALRRMCKKNNYTFVNVSDIFADHPELYAGDGIHAQIEYYPYWLDRMIEKAGL